MFSASSCRCASFFAFSSARLAALSAFSRLLRIFCKSARQFIFFAMLYSYILPNP